MIVERVHSFDDWPQGSGQFVLVVLLLFEGDRRSISAFCINLISTEEDHVEAAKEKLLQTGASQLVHGAFLSRRESPVQVCSSS